MKKGRQKQAEAGGGTPKIGLHQRNRQKRVDAILLSAAEMFRQNGFEATRIEDIAQHAEVSAGTIYAYFETKDNILMAILAKHRDSTVPRRRGIVENPPSDLVEAFVAYERALLNDVTRFLDRDLWRRVTAAGVMQPETRLGGISVDIDRVAQQERRRILEILAQRDKLLPGPAVERLAEVLRALSYHVWIRFLRGEYASVAAAQTNIERNLAFVLGAVTTHGRGSGRAEPAGRVRRRA